MRTFVHGGGRLPEGIDAALAHYRHQVFVGRLGWQLPMADGTFERDQYDRDDTVYVVARDAGGTICGCARLLPTTRPYLLKEVFASLLMHGMPPPESPEVWELSRFAARSGAPYLRSGRAEWAVRPMLASVVQCAAQRGARRLIGATFVSMVRLFRRIGVRAHRAGPVRCIGGRPVVACWIDIDASTCAALGIPSASVAPGPVLQ
ncbi:acyl-homoserine-lactone synthase SolI [Ralstonia solanacearum]|uniref:Acyl-homoserine-lactone synthase n=1 Tax=Ralstonia solanacearum TaxID=305 RepID=A0AAE3NLC2_RALSL|nr:acyl-homoserine-lactone synthase SolI [Ralstonia solanacearum]MBB6580509.1 GNAT family N-acetyltransferase [Ralstonia solanacearum]MDB0523861.1 GNAT family N-acetyltransferase [Ralstonia solanacearum]